MERVFLRTGLALLALLTSGALFAAAVTRGPYLQLQTESSITLRWRTDIATDSVVRFGLTAGNLDQSVTVAGTRTEHKVTLSGLPADQQYFYSVGDSIAPLAGDATYHFRTAPARGLAADTRIWVIGDSGTADANAVAVRNAYTAWAGANPADFWLMLGDNAYNDGTDAEYQAAVFNIYPQMLRQMPVWPTLGNHDGHTADSATQSGPYYDIFDLPKEAEAGGLASGTEAYYSFDYANIHFICLDSYDTSRAPSGAMMQWLEADLAVNTQPWIIAFFHHPPYSKGSHNSDTEAQLIDMRQNALPRLEAWGVDLVLTGHSHSYERSYLLDGHYGVSTTLDPVNHVLDPGDGRVGGNGAYEKPALVAAQNAGAVYAVAGSSGKISGGALNHPAMFISLNSLGSMVLDVSGDRLDAVFLDQAGTVRDSFTLQKTPDFEPPLLAAASAEDATHVLVDFNEPVDSTTASNAANYSIGGLSVSAVQLVGASRVRLTTSAMTSGTAYTLSVSNVRDLSGNAVLPGSTIGFTFHAVTTVSFQDGLAPDPGYAGTRDAYIRQATATTAYGLQTSLQVDGDEPAGSSSDMNILLAFDLAQIPAGAVVESASIRFEVTNVSTGSYTCYALLRPWVESETTWNRASAAAAWGGAGATAASDRDSAPLCTVNAASLGALTVPLNAAGIARVQGWVDTPSANHGLVIASPSTTDGADFHSSESATALARPKLNVTYSVAAPPPNNAPVASFLDDCNDLDCNFSDTSTDSDGTVVAWAWDFGDGSNSSAQNPAHRFAAAGDYSVSLTVTDDDGAESQAVEIVTVTEPPPVPQAVLSDSFENGAWGGLWTQDTQNDWFTSTQRAFAGTSSAEVDGAAADAQLVSIPIDLQGLTAATITFNWLIESGLDSGEYIAFDVSTNGGVAWTQRAILRGNVNAENTWHPVQIELDGIGALKMRFRARMSASDEDANVDAITVTAAPGSPVPPVPLELFNDSFEFGAWAGLWTQDPQNDWYTSTQRATAGTVSAEVDGGATDAQLVSVPIDLKGNTAASITFNWLIESGLDTGEYIAFDVSTNGGSSWVQHAILRGNVDPENAWRPVQVDLGGIGALRLRFRGRMSGSDEDANVDAISVIVP